MHFKPKVTQVIRHNGFGFFFLQAKFRIAVQITPQAGQFFVKFVHGLSQVAVHSELRATQSFGDKKLVILI